MKKFTFLALFTFCFFQSYAQFGVRAGYNIPTVSFDGEGFNDFIASSSGFQFGLTYQAALSNSLSIRPGALYSIKGFKTEVVGFEGKAAFNYLEIPLDFVFGAYNSEAFGIDVHAGPYFAYLLSGFEEDDNGDKRDFDFSGEDDESKRSDIGLNLGATVDFSGVYVGLNYGLGFSNLSSEPDEPSATNRNLSIIAGYMFGGTSVSN